MDISISNLGGNSSPSVSSLISQLVSKRTQSLNSLLDQKSQIENSLAALQSGALGIGSINNSYSDQIASLQDTIDKLNEQYSINANKITTINSLKKSYSSTVSSLEKYIETLKNPNSSNTDLDIYLDGNKVSSNNKVDVTINDKNTNVQEITLNVTQIATTSTLKSNVLLGGAATANTKITDLFAGIFDAENNSIKTNRQDLKESLRLRDLGVTSGSFNLGSAKITIDAENDTIGDLIQKIKDAGYNAQIETTSYDDNGEAVGRLLISGSDDKSISITNQTSNITSLLGLTVSEGNFYINGAEFTITADSTLGSLMKEINSASADNVGAKLEGGKLVFVASETGAVDINVEKGTSNFTNAIGFTIGGVMNESNLVLGSDGSYVTLIGQNSSVKLTDSVNNGKFTEGNFNLYYNTVDEHGKVSSDLTKVIIEVNQNDTIDSIIKKIENQTAGSYVDEEGNTIRTGLTAELVNGCFTIRQIQKGAEFDISIEAGSSNFTNYVGMTTQVSNTTSKDAENSYILGTTVVPNSGFTEGSFTVSTNKLADDGKTALFETISAVIEVTSTDTAQTIADKITNAGLDLTASITSDGHFKIEQNNSGVDFDITVTAGGTNFTQKAGLTSNVINTGVLSPGSDVNQYTTLTGANTVSGSTAVSEGTIKINGVIIDIAKGNINSAINNINAHKGETGVNAYLKDGKLVLQSNKTGPDYSIVVESGNSNLGEITGLVTQMQSIGTKGENDSKTTLTAANNVTGSTAVSGGTFVINDVIVNINKGTINSAIADINSYTNKTGVHAYLKDGKVVLEANETGSEYSITVEAGDSDFGKVAGFVTEVKPTGSLIETSTKTTLTGSTSVTGSTAVSKGTIKINGIIIDIKAGNINSAISDINAYSDETGFTAYLRNGKVVLEANETGSDYTITLEAGDSNFGKVAGFVTEVSSTGTLVETSTKTSLTGSKSISGSTSVSGGTFKINGITIDIGAGNINSAIEDINAYSDKTGFTAYLRNGKVVLEANKTGSNYTIYVEGGTSNFGTIAGFVSASSGAVTAVVGQTGSKTTLTGAYDVTKDMQISAGTININGLNINIEADTLEKVIVQINKYSDETGVTASIKNGKFVLTNTKNGDMAINVTDGTSNLGELTGITSYQTEIGREEILGATQTTMTASKSGLQKSDVISDSKIQINGQTINLSQDIGHAIDQINAYTNMTGVEAYLDSSGRFVLRNIETGSKTINFKDISGDFTRVIGAASSSTSAGSSGQTGTAGAVLTGGIDGLTENTAIMGGGTLNVGGTSISLDGLDTIGEVIDKINSSGAKATASLNEYGQLVFNGKEHGQNIDVSYSGNGNFGYVTGFGSYSIGSDTTNNGIITGDNNATGIGNSGYIQGSENIRNPIPAGVCLSAAEAREQGYTVIASAAQLVQFLQGKLRSNTDKYILGANIDLSAYRAITSGFTGSNPFRGEFNGNGYSIIGLKIESTEQEQYTGMFGVADGALISNLTLVDATVEASSNTAGVTGILAGIAANSSIVNVHVVGGSVTASNATSNGSVGSLVGVLGGSFISASSSSASVNATNVVQVGGLAGNSEASSITNSAYSGQITADESIYCGGIVGLFDGRNSSNMYYSRLENNIMTGTIQLTLGDYFGNLAGLVNGGSVKNNIALVGTYIRSLGSNISGMTNFQLEAADYKNQAMSLFNALDFSAQYWMKTTDGIRLKSEIALEQQNRALVTSAFKRTHIKINGIDINVGGTVFDVIDQINAKTEQTGVVASLGSSRKFTLENADGSTKNIIINDANIYSSDDKDFWKSVGVDIEAAQSIDSTDSASSSSVVRLTEEEAIAQGYTVIKTASQLSNIRNNLSGKYILMGDIDLSGYSNFTPIGTEDAAFTGELNGNGYTISNLKVDSDEGAGLFGVTDGALLQNINIKNANVDGLYAGILVGNMIDSTIISVSTSGNVYSSAFAGGIVGLINGKSSITESSADVVVDINSATYSGAGGLIGAISQSSDLYISDSYATGKIDGSLLLGAGGLIGSDVTSNSLEIANSYASVDISNVTSAVGDYVNGFIGYFSGDNLTISNSFWNKDNAQHAVYDQDNNGLFVPTGLKGVSGSSISSSAQSAGWDNSIWDFSENMPVLKREIYNSQISEGNIIINNKVVNISGGSVYDAVDDINAKSSETGVTALINDYGQLVLKNSDDSTDNITISGGTSNLWDVVGIDPAEHQGNLEYTEGEYSFLEGRRDTTDAKFGEDGSITIKKGSDSLKIDISAGDSVQNIVNKINNADAGFKASLVVSNGKQYFRIESTTEGKDAVSVTVNSGDFGRVTGMATYSSPGATSVSNPEGDKIVGGVGNITGNESGFSGGSFTITLGHDAADSNGGLVVGSSNVTDVGRLSEEEARAQGYKIIKTAADLNNIRYDLDGKYILMGDIDLSSYSSWTAIGTSSSSFTGELNGNGYTISNLTINSTSTYQGLFGYTDGATFSNLNLSNVDVTSSSSSVGALAGHALDATITNVHILSGYVKGYSNVGGLVGYTYNADITQSSSAASVTSRSQYAYVGGLVGNLYISTISHSYSTGNICASNNNTSTYSGGLVGYMQGTDSLIEYSYATGTIDNVNGKSGGIVGYATGGSFDHVMYKAGTGAVSASGGSNGGANLGSYASFSSTLSKSSWVGYGFTEDIWDFSGTGAPTLISQKSKDAEVTSGSIYINDTSISLSAGSISDAIDAINAKSSTTGVIASINSDGNVVFENKDGSSDNIALRITAAGSNFFSVAGIAVDNKGILNGSNNVKTETTQLSESQAKAQGYTIIKTASDLYNIRNNLSGKYILMDDIDLSSYSNWTAIGTLSNSFKGELNGNGYTIKNLTIDSTTNYKGLFGYTNGATISNLNLSSANVTSTSNYVGALVGYAANSTISNVHVLSGSVTGSCYVGGLVGYISNSDITQSSSAANVTSTSTVYSYVGGLIGQMIGGSISDSFVSGTVTSKNTSTSDLEANFSIGGIVGSMTGSATLQHSYANVKISTANTKRAALVGYLSGSTVKSNLFSARVKSDNSTITNVASRLKGSYTSEGNISFDYITSTTSSDWTNAGFSSSIWNITSSGAPTLKPVTTEVYLEVSAGTIVINGVTINLTAGTMDDIVDQINAKSSSTGVAALINSSGKVELSNKNGSLNSISLTEGTSNFFEVAGLAAEKRTVSVQLTEQEAKAQGYTIIKTAADLNNIRNDLDGKYILMGDIDLSSYSNWSAIGSYTTNAFSGIFNGNGYTISNLKMNITGANQMFSGLFGYTSGAEISNLTLENVTIKSTLSSASGGAVLGSLIGLAEDTAVYNVSVVGGSINSKNYSAGGLIGAVSGDTTIERSSVDINMTSASQYTGGLVGIVGNGASVSIINSYVQNDFLISNDSNVEYLGGLVGYLVEGIRNLDIKNSYVYANVDDDAGIFPGGIIGYGADMGGNSENIDITNTYYNGAFDESNGDGAGPGGDYLNNSEFKDKSNFVDWDESIWDFSGTGAPTLKPAVVPETETVTINIEENDSVRNVLDMLKDKGFDADIVDGHVVINGYTSIESISGTSDFGKYVGLQSGSMSSGISSITGTDGTYTFTGNIVKGMTGSIVLGGLKAGTFTVNGKTVNVSSTDTVTSVLNKIKTALGSEYISGSVSGEAVIIKANTSLYFEDGSSNFASLAGLVQGGFEADKNYSSTDGSVGFGRLTGSVTGLKADSSIGALEDGSLTISQGSSSLTIDVSKYDTIQSLIDKINTSTDFEAGLDSQGRFYIQSKNESTEKIVVDAAGSTNLDELLGLSSGSFSGSMSQDVGSNGYIKITGSVDFGTSSSAGKVVIPDKFAGGKTFTITGNTGGSFTVNISNDMTINTLISKINASGKFTAGINSDGYFYIQAKEGVTDITFSGTSGLEDYLGLSDTSEKISSGASQSTGKFDKYSTLTGTAVVTHNMTFSEGNFILTVGGKSVDIDVLDGESITSVINKINNSGLGVTASIQNNRFVIAADNPGNISMSIKDGTSNFAELTGFVTKAGTQIVSQDKGSIAEYVSANTAESAQNAGISAGDFFVHLTDLNGNITDTAKITVSENEDISSIIEKINKTGLGVTASVNDEGKMVITRNSSDTEGGVLVTKGSSDFTTKIGYTSGGSQSVVQDKGSIAEYVSANTAQSAQNAGISAGDFFVHLTDLTGKITNTVKITVSENEDISSIIEKINKSGLGVTASLNDEGKMVITRNSSDTEGGVLVTKGSSDFTTKIGYTSGGAQSVVQNKGSKAEYISVNTAESAQNAGISAGDFFVHLTDTSGKITDTVKITVVENETIASIIDKINNSGLGVTASVNDEGKMVITRNSSDTEGGVLVTKGSSDFTTKIGYTSGGAQAVTQKKGVLSTYTSANTAQSAQNAGISAGDFYVHLTDMNGNITNTVKITIGKNENITSIIEKINNSGLGVTASINDSGKMVITRNSSDTAGGVLVTKGSSDFTNKIGYTSGGYQTPSTIYGSQAVLTSVNPISTSQKFSNGDFIIVVEDNGIVKETSIDVFESDSIYDIIDRINNADIGVTASLNANNKLVITKDVDTSDGIIGIKKGSSDFTTIFGFSSGGVFNGSHETGEAATHTVLVSNKLAVSGKATMASLGVTDGAFRINGVEIAIKSTDTIDDVIGRINSVFNSAIYDYNGVTAEYKNNQIVLTSKKASSNARIEIESGSTNFTEVVGFTNMGSRDNVVDMGQNAQFNIKIGDDEVGTDYDLALDLKDITNDNIYNGNNLIYLNTDGKVVEHANNAAITIEIKETGETIIRIGQNVLDASINELNKFVGNFNKAMIASENEILSDDAEFAALISNIKAALTDDVADLRKIQQQMAEIGITVDIRGGTNSNMGTVRLYLDREKYTQAFYDDSQHVMDLLIGKETAVGVEDGVLTRLNNVLYPEVNNKNGYFNKVPRTLQAVQKELNREITRTTFQLNELKLAVSGQTGVGEGLTEYLAKLEEQYNFVNEAISNLNKQYASSVTRLILNQNNAGFNPIVT